MLRYPGSEANGVAINPADSSNWVTPRTRDGPFFYGLAARELGCGPGNCWLRTTVDVEACRSHPMVFSQVVTSGTGIYSTPDAGLNWNFRQTSCRHDTRTAHSPLVFVPLGGEPKLTRPASPLASGGLSTLGTAPV